MVKRRRNQRRSIPIENEPQHMIRQLQELETPCCATCYSEDGEQGTILLPLPKCTCTLKLVQGPLPHPVEMILLDLENQNQTQQRCRNGFGSSKSKQKPQLLEKVERSNKVSQITSYLHLSELHLERHNHVPMCKCCIEKMIEVSSEVIELEYHDRNQPNPKFTVEAKCPHCSSKFSHRGLQRLLKSERSKEWESSLVFTTNVVDVMKVVTARIQNMNTSNIKKNTEKTCANTINQFYTKATSMKNISNNQNDNCHNNISIIDRNVAKTGELLQDRIQCDPLYKQEVEDLKYIQKLMKSSEGLQKLGLLDQRKERKRSKIMEDKDRKFAEKLHFQLNKQKFNSSFDRKHENDQTTMTNFILKPNFKRHKDLEDNKNERTHYNHLPKENQFKQKQRKNKYIKSKHVIDLCSSSDEKNDFLSTSKYSSLEQIYSIKKESFEHSLHSISDNQIDNTKPKLSNDYRTKYSSQSQQRNFKHLKTPNARGGEKKYIQHKSKLPLTFFQPNQMTQQSLEQSEVNNKTCNHDTSNTFQPDQLNVSAKILLSLQKKKGMIEKSPDTVSHAKNFFSKTKPLNHRDISSLVAMGFPRNKAMKCLQECNGNLTLTVSMLSGPNV